MASPRRTYDLPEDLFPPPADRPPPPSPLERYLGRERDATGRLVPVKKPRRSKTVAAAKHDRARCEAEEMIRTTDWSACAARHIVALYDLMHERTYGVESSMTSAERYRCTLMAGGFVKRHFRGDFEAAIDYLRWVWTREIGREARRRETGADGGRIGFALMVSTSMLDDWRVANARRGVARADR